MRDAARILTHALAWACVAGFAAGQQPAPSGLDGLVQELTSTDPAVRSEAYVKLAAEGDKAVESLLTDFGKAPPLARELRARLLRDHGRAVDTERIGKLAADPSPVVRGEIVKFAARPDFAFANAEARARLLLTLADDPEFGVREAAIQGLQRLSHPSAIDGLALLVRSGDAVERRSALTALASTPRSAPALLELARFVDTAAPSLRETYLLCLGATGDSSVMAELLRWARDPVAGAAARTGLDWLLQRQISRREETQFYKTLDAWSAVDPADALWRRARYDLLVRGDVALARASAVKLDALAERDPDGAFASRSGAAIVDAFCAITEGEGAAAEAALDRAIAWIEREREAAADDAAADALLIPLARVRAVSALNALVNPFPAAPAPFARVKTAYELYAAWARSALTRSLQGICAKDPLILNDYLVKLREGIVEPIQLSAGWTFDAALTSDLGPSTLIALALPRRGRGKEGLEAGRRLLDLLSDVNPREFVNARHAKDWQSAADPFQGMRLLDVPGIVVSPVYVSVKTSLSSLPRELGQVARSIVGDFKVAAELLDPVIERASFGTQVGDLEVFVEGSIERAGVAMDARDGAKADAIVSKVLDKLDAVKRSNEDDFDLEEVKRLGAATVEALRTRARMWLDKERRLRSQALITRAVNENVVRGHPDIAARYAKKGVELEPTEFNRVLLACYLAREGNAVEARAVLRDVIDSAGTYYNLACTYALLGETETSLHYLERDFEQHKDFGSIERQRAWARRDPDLKSLEGAPRFRALVAEGPASRPR